MKRSLEARLERQLARAAAAAAGARGRCCTRHSRAAIGAALRCWLAQAGIEPARAVMLPIADEAVAMLAETPEPTRRDAGQRESVWFDPATAGLIERYRGGTLPDPDPAKASLAELFAWCIARNAVDEPFADATEKRDVCC